MFGPIKKHLFLCVFSKERRLNLAINLFIYVLPIHLSVYLSTSVLIKGQHFKNISNRDNWITQTKSLYSIIFSLPPPRPAHVYKITTFAFYFVPLYRRLGLFHDTSCGTKQKINNGKQGRKGGGGVMSVWLLI